MPNSLFIGLKSSERYSPIILEFLGLVAQGVAMGTNAKEIFDFTGQTYILEHGARLMLLDNQEALVKKNKLECAEFGRIFVAFLNNEYPVPELNLEDKKIADENEKLALAANTIPRAVELILRKHPELAQDIADLDSEWLGKDVNNDISILLNAIKILNKLDETSDHDNSFIIELTHLVPQGLTPETDPVIVERQCALAVIQQLFSSSFKVNRIGVLELINSVKQCTTADEILDIVEDYISLFYELPLQDLILKIEDDIVAKIREDETFHKYLELLDKKDPQKKTPKIINSFNEFANIFAEELDKFIEEWITMLIQNNDNKSIDIDKYSEHEASVIKHRAELLSWLDYLNTFFNELEPREEEIEKLINLIKSFDDSEDNPVLERLNYLNELIKTKLSYFEKFSLLYIDSAALVTFESSEDRTFQGLKRDLLFGKYVTNHLTMIKTNIVEWDKKRDTLSQDIKQLNSSKAPLPKQMILPHLLKPIVSLTNSILELFQNTQSTLSRIPKLLDLDGEKIIYSHEIDILKQANSENRQFYHLSSINLYTEKTILVKFFDYIKYRIEKREKTFNIKVKNLIKECPSCASEIKQAESFSNNPYLRSSSPIHSRSDEDSPPAKKAKLNNKGKEEENDEEINTKTTKPPFMA